MIKELINGDCVNVNINLLSKKLGIHRATVQKKVRKLMEEEVLTQPAYTFPALFQLYPLLVLVWADVPRNDKTARFFFEDPHVFAAFSCMEGPYNTFLIEYFQDMEHYHLWRDSLVREGKLPERLNRAAADPYMLSNKMMFKNDPSCFLSLLREELELSGKVNVGEWAMDSLSFEILVALIKGDCVWTNHSRLSKKLDMHRKTVTRRLNRMLRDKTLEHPRCQFPHLLMPPGFNMVVTRIGLRSRREEFRRALVEDSNVPRAYDAITGPHNFVAFTAFRRIDDFFDWGEKLNDRFPGEITAMTNSVLSSRKIHTTRQQKISLGLVERKLKEMVQNKSRSNKNKYN